MSKDKVTVHVEEQRPLRWAKGWPHTPISERKPMKAWKKSFEYYKNALAEVLRKVGATKVVISYNEGEQARRDPGVTIYFYKPLKVDFSWQVALGIDNPAPTLNEIDEAFRHKAMQHHPDRLGDKATAEDIEIFKNLGRHKEQAKAWVMGTHESDRPYSLPCDRFTEPRWNLNALRLGIASIRRLDEYGLPGLLERVAQPELLTAHASGGEKHGTSATA